MSKNPYNEYLLVMPNGNTKGFNDLELAKAYINLYYEKKIDDGILEEDYNDATERGAEEPRRNICTQLGVAEGKCEIYNLRDFINKLENELVFDSEKEEVISKLMGDKVEINLYEYGLDKILTDAENIDVIEPYGDPD